MSSLLAISAEYSVIAFTTKAQTKQAVYSMIRCKTHFDATRKDGKKQQNASLNANLCQ